MSERPRPPFDDPDFDGVLVEVVAQFGRRIVDRPERLRAVLADTVGTASATAESDAALRARIDAIVTASALGVASSIRDSDPAVAATPDEIRAWFDQLVQAGLSLRDAALAAHSWATAFNASATAQMTEEVSDQLSQSEPAAEDVADRDVTNCAAVSASASSTGAAGAGADATADSGAMPQTVLGPEFDESRTVGVEGSVLVAPAPTDPALAALAPPQSAPTRSLLQPPAPQHHQPVPRNHQPVPQGFRPSLEQLALLAPPNGAPATGLEAPAGPITRRAPRPASAPSAPGARGWPMWLRTPWPAVVAGALALAAAAITVPIILGGPPPPPEPGELTASAGALFTEGEVALFVLDEDALRSMSPASTDISAPSDWGVTEVTPAETTASAAECAPLLWYSPGTNGTGVNAAASGSSVYGGYAWNGYDGSVTSYGRIYPTPEIAAGALRALAPASCEAGFETTSKGETLTPVVDVQDVFTYEGGIEVLETGLAFGDRTEFRVCGRDLNLVVCHWTVELPEGSAGPSIAALVNAFVDTANAYQPLMGRG
ncbi:hypothetical protein [Ruicaihuangia caeni]|uniref:hypothetical protein n=1 Tax=Ruicaihuangia caeni TaxID=3042517 RepID=UPI00338E850E